MFGCFHVFIQALAPLPQVFHGLVKCFRKSRILDKFSKYPVPVVDLYHVDVVDSSDVDTGKTDVVAHLEAADVPEIGGEAKHRTEQMLLLANDKHGHDEKQDASCYKSSQSCFLNTFHMYQLKNSFIR